MYYYKIFESGSLMVYTKGDRGGHAMNTSSLTIIVILFG